MPSDPRRDDNSLFDASAGPFENSEFGDPFAGSSDSQDSAPSGGDSIPNAPDSLGSGSPDGFDAFGADGFGSSGGGTGGGNGNRPQRQPFPPAARLAMLIAAALLILVILSHIFTPGTISVSLGVDPGDIVSTITDQGNGAYHVSLKHVVSDLDPSQFYIAGFMMAPEGESLVAVGDPYYISSASSYTATAEFLVTQPGTYSLAFYAYSLLDPLPSITRTFTVSIGDGSQPQSPSDESLIILVTPTPTPLPAVTPTPVPTAPPDTPTTPVSTPLKLRPDSDVFDLYDVNTRYYYHLLTDAQKVIFSEIYDGILNTQEEIALSRCSDNDFDYAIHAIFYDCPELFLLDYELHPYHTYNQGGQVVSVVLPDFYRLSASAYRAQLEQVMQTIRSFASLPDFGFTDYSKELAISTYIVDHTVYERGVPNCAYADSVYLYGFAKCTGYTNAFNLALRYYGIPCATITGNTFDNGVISPIGHMWSLVQIDGQWYHCDATWNDQENDVDLFPYFNLNDRLIFSARSLEITAENDMIFPLPQCTSLAQNFVMQEGVFIPSGANVTDEVANCIVNAFNSGEDELIIMFESAADMSTAVIQFQNKGISNRIANIRKGGLGYIWSACPEVNTILVYGIYR